jgi:hypothetical protein
MPHILKVFGFLETRVGVPHYIPEKHIRKRLGMFKVKKEIRIY